MQRRATHHIWSLHLLGLIYSTIFSPILVSIWIIITHNFLRGSCWNLYKQVKKTVQWTLFNLCLQSPEINILPYLFYVSQICIFDEPYENKLQTSWHFIPKFLIKYLLKTFSYITTISLSHLKANFNSQC